MQGAFLIIFTLIFSGGTLMFDGLIGHGLFKQYQSAHWVRVDGTVTDSRIETHHGSKGGVSYSAVVTYKYVVDGRFFSNNRMRYGISSSGSYARAQETVNAHPSGSALSVYYNPANPAEALLFPGIRGEDLLVLLFLMPFNSFSLGAWVMIYRWARERLARPVAGGVTLITDGLSTRVRLPQSAACLWGLATMNITGIVSVVIIAINTQENCSMGLALSAIAGSLLAGLAVYAWRRSIAQSGIDDLVINEANRTLELPLTHGRKERLTVALADINELYTEVVAHRGSKGGVSYTYAPTLFVRGDNGGPQKLADWSDKLKADDFTTWLRQKLGLANRD